MSSLAPKQGQVNSTSAPELSERVGAGRLPTGSARPGGVAGVSLETRETSRQTSSSKRRWRARKAEQSREEKLESIRKRAAAENATVLRSLRTLGRVEEAEDIERCGRLVVYDCGGCGERSGRVYFTCRHRLCTYCLRSRATRIANKLVELVDAFFNPVHVVFTIKNGHDLDERAKHLRSGWRRFWHRVEVKKHFRGGYAFEEVGHSAATGWHVHLHCLMDGRMPKQQMQDIWLECTGDSFIVDISYIYPDGRRGAIMEAAKYPCKLSSIINSPELVEQYLVWARGRRMFWSFGTCYGHSAVLAEAEAAEEYEELPEDKEVCPHCGTIGEMKHVAGAVLFRGQCWPVKQGWWVLAPPGPGQGVSSG